MGSRMTVIGLKKKEKKREPPPQHTHEMEGGKQRNKMHVATSPQVITRFVAPEDLWRQRSGIHFVSFYAVMLCKFL